MKKRASDITRFQKHKEYGTWFNKLFNVMKSTATCQPEGNLYNLTSRTMVAAVIRRRGVQTRIHQQILEKKKNNKKRKLFVSINKTTKKRQI